MNSQPSHLLPLKLHLLSGIIILNIIGIFFDSPPPYYPIELSRIAASRSLSLNWFRFLILSLVVHFFIIDEIKTYSLPCIWFSLLIIVVFDDFNHWWLHMLGVAGLFLSVIFYGIETSHMPSTVNNAFIIGTIVILWATRVAIKVAAIYFFELKEGQGFGDIGKISQDIMYNGPSVCMNPEITMIPFKLGGVIQWTCFWLMSEMVKY
jgi:hypothetical protein